MDPVKKHELIIWAKPFIPAKYWNDPFAIQVNDIPVKSAMHQIKGFEYIGLFEGIRPVYYLVVPEVKGVSLWVYNLE